MTQIYETLKQTVRIQDPSVCLKTMQIDQIFHTENRTFVNRKARAGEKVMRHPGFEPGSTAWKAAILTTRLMARC